MKIQRIITAKGKNKRLELIFFLYLKWYMLFQWHSMVRTPSTESEMQCYTWQNENGEPKLRGFIWLVHLTTTKQRKRRILNPESAVSRTHLTVVSWRSSKVSQQLTFHIDKPRTRRAAPGSKSISPTSLQSQSSVHRWTSPRSPASAPLAARPLRVETAAYWVYGRRKRPGRWCGGLPAPGGGGGDCWCCVFYFLGVEGDWYFCLSVTNIEYMRECWKRKGGKERWHLNLMHYEYL